FVPLDLSSNRNPGAWYNFEIWMAACLASTCPRRRGTLEIIVDYNLSRNYRRINVPTKIRVLVSFYDIGSTPSQDRIVLNRWFSFKNDGSGTFDLNTPCEWL